MGRAELHLVRNRHLWASDRTDRDADVVTTGDRRGVVGALERS